MSLTDTWVIFFTREENKNVYGHGSTDKMAYQGALYKLTGDEELYQINDKVVENMFRNLSIKAIKYGAGLIKQFYDATKSTSGGSSGVSIRPGIWHEV